MCIFFDNKEKAQEAYEVMKDVYYPHEQKSLVSQQAPRDMDITGSIAIGIAPLILIFFILFSKYLFTQQ